MTKYERGDCADDRSEGNASRLLQNASARWVAFGARMFDAAMRDNIEQIASLIKSEDSALDHEMLILDLGCWDASTTSSYVPVNSRVIGVETSVSAASRAAERGYGVVAGDLNRRLPFPDNTFDAVTSNQVIEHLHDTDRFMSEAFRTLRPGGLLCVSTENLASWHNIVALVLGWQAFSLSNVSKNRPGLGNPLANWRHHDEPIEDGWLHQRIFSYRGLIELTEAVGFASVCLNGSGYYPFPTCFAHQDPRHAAFMTVTGRKPSL